MSPVSAVLSFARLHNIYYLTSPLHTNFWVYMGARHASFDDLQKGLPVHVRVAAKEVAGL